MHEREGTISLTRGRIRDSAVEWKKKANPREIKRFVDERIGDMIFIICENIKSEHQQNYVARSN